eukprot:2785969-Pleurochrysis_carterae.AAC.1
MGDKPPASGGLDDGGRRGRPADRLSAEAAEAATGAAAPCGRREAGALKGRAGPTDSRQRSAPTRRGGEADSAP